MSEQPDTRSTAAPAPGAVPPVDPPTAVPGETAAPYSSDGAAPADSGAAAVVNERPEVAVGAAFVGGLALALILKRLVN